MRVARIFGIDIYVDISWLFIFALVAYMLTVALPFNSVALPLAERIALGVGTALLFFASVLAHELAHSVVARARGVPVSRITLFIFGGISSLGGDFENATGEGIIAFVGPLMSMALAVLFYLIALGLHFDTPLGAAARYLGFANAVLAVFNLLPAYPLDGGKVLHSFLWRTTGDRLRATRIAAAIGRTIAIIIIAFGVIQFIFGSLGGLWYAFIGWFLYQAGGAEAFQSELSSSLRGRSALDVATTPPPPIKPDDSVQSAMETLLRSGQRAAPVSDGSRLLGIVTLTDVAKVDGSHAATTPVSAVMTPLEKITSVKPSVDSLAALQLLGQSGFHQIPVIDDSGALQGFVTRDSLLRRLAVNRG